MDGSKVGSYPADDDVPLGLTDITKPKGPHGKTWIFKQIKEGRLTVIKCGRRTLVRRPDYRAFLNSFPAS